MLSLWHLLVHATGCDYGAPYGRFVPYNFWSGFGSDIGELAVFAGLTAMVRRFNCEVRGCWHLGRHQTAAGHRVCRLHSPDGAPTRKDVLNAHRAALKTRGPGKENEGETP